MADQLSDRIGEIVEVLERSGNLGQRFKGPTDKDEIRFGKHGSLSIVLVGDSRGVWFDFEVGAGGGVTDLIEKYGGRDWKAWVDDNLRRTNSSHHNGRDDWASYEPDYGPDPGGNSTGPLATYDYTDENGVLLFQVCRFPNHKFLQRAPDGTWKVKGIRKVLYHLPELVAAKKTGNGHPWRVYLCEGEKDADRLRKDWGVVATTNPGGAGYWQDDYNACFSGAEIIMLEDNDEAGRQRTEKLAPRLAKAAVTLRIIRFPTLPEKGDISDWLDEGGSQSTLEEIIEDTAPFYSNGHDTTQGAKLWTTVLLSDFHDKDIPSREWIMEDWIPRGQTTGLYGASNVRKTDWLIQLMLAAATGSHFCGRKITQVPVYGLFCEDDTNEILRRAQRLAKAAYGLDLSQIPNFHFASLVGIMDTEFLTWDMDKRKTTDAFMLLEEELALYKPGLVPLDTLPDFFGGSENDRRQTSGFIRFLDGISIKYGCALVCAAHPSMRGRSSGRYDSGNTGIDGKMRARLSLHDPGEDADEDETPEERATRIALHPTDKRILTRQNSNYAKPGETIELVIRNDGDGEYFYPAAIDPNSNTGPMYDAEVRNKFKEILSAVIAAGDYVNNAKREHHAPRVFRKHPLNRKSKYSERDFNKAMVQLVADNVIYLLSNNRAGTREFGFR